MKAVTKPNPGDAHYAAHSFNVALNLSREVIR
jgi:hypothetical protein